MIAHRIANGPIVQMIGNIYSIHLVLSVSVFVALLSGSIVQADQSKIVRSHLVEVFTTTDSPITGEAACSHQRVCMENELHIYNLDGIQRFESQLSSDLPVNPDQSKQIALQRIQQLDEQATSAIQNAAVGLATAMQYGIDRYPAIVFDGKVVVYGLTDLKTALDYYLTWRAGARL